MTTASHAAGLGLWQTVWVMQVLARGTGGRVLSAIAFYEKVIKVKADVAAFLINCFPSA